MDALTQSNYSLYAIPAFWVLILLPHVYATATIKEAANGRFDNHNPHGDSYKTYIKKTCPAETYTKWERAEAAHRNGFENLPLFAAAVIAGNMARLDNGVLNLCAVAFLGLRVAHTVAYVTISDRNLSFVRSGMYFLSTGCCLYLLVSAANVMAKGGPAMF